MRPELIFSEARDRGEVVDRMSRAFAAALETGKRASVSKLCMKARSSRDGELTLSRREIEDSKDPLLDCASSEGGVLALDFCFGEGGVGRRAFPSASRGNRSKQSRQ